MLSSTKAEEPIPVVRLSSGLCLPPQRMDLWRERWPVRALSPWDEQPDQDGSGSVPASLGWAVGDDHPLDLILQSCMAAVNGPTQALGAVQDFSVPCVPLGEQDVFY